MDGKKKKNRKKKGNSQSGVDVSAGVDEGLAPELGNGSAPQRNHIPRVQSATDVQSVGVSESDVELDRHKVYEQRFDKILEEVRKLQDEKNQWLQKEADLEEKINLLQSYVDNCMKKEAATEEKFKILQSGNNFLIQKEVAIEERVKHMEGITGSWTLKESLLNEMASKLDEVNLRMLEQVKELKGSTDGLLQENTQLRESIAVMESRLHHIATEVSFIRPSSAMIAEQPPVEKLLQQQYDVVPLPLIEKQEPKKSRSIEKVKELHAESDQHNVEADYSGTREVEPVDRPTESTASTDYLPDYGKEMSESSETLSSLSGSHNPFGITNSGDDFGSLSRERHGQLLGMDNSMISEDVVSVPLDDIHVQEVEPQPAKADETPLSDAPLIGAPFRLISYFAKYVSGADLVQQDGSRSG